MSKKRNRFIYGITILVVIIAGLGSRYYSDSLPEFVSAYAGDTLWGLMIFLGFGLIFNQKSTKLIFISAIIFSFFIEVSQLYQAEWINLIRQTLIGGLILGFGFLWSDLACYFIGISIGAILEKQFY